MKLYRATISFDFYVAADDAAAARREAWKEAFLHAHTGPEIVEDVREVRAVEELLPDDLDSVPVAPEGYFGERLLTCAEVLAEVAKARKPDDLPGQGKLFVEEDDHV